MNRKKTVTILFIFISLLSFGQLPKITFTPHWLPQSQFAGYYMALEKGFYEQEGIDVDIVHPSASLMATDRLLKEESDIISLFLITALATKSEELDMVNISQLSQNSALLFVSKKGSGIKSIEDLNNKRIGIWESGFDEVPKALVNSNNYKVDWIPILSSVNMFMIDGVDAMTVMWYNEYDQIINSGFNPDELNTFLFSDYGYNIPEDGLYCLNKTLIQRKDDLRKFVAGTFRGWEYAKENKEETLAVVLRLMTEEHIPTNLAHQSWMLDQVLKLIEPGIKSVEKGELAESDFHKTQNILYEGKYIDKKYQFSEFYKPVK
ncbi:MAG: ABC transporter substrate-binding protein [Prolixibacteraceae bacterium]|jgi:NitT/TauT family transport system substrate-binding protein|nr:ABC transporter substrate-binding protein [Prolixibacteraceae bacterium]